MLNPKDLSLNRQALMGFAMIAIVLFHVPLARSEAFFPLRRLGNVGVDMFLFLSGVGLWFSWQKSQDVLRFYRRRLLRLLPSYVLIAAVFYGWDVYLNGFAGKSSGVLPLLGNILFGLSFWQHTDLTFWFVPAILALYVIAPWYMRLISRFPSWRILPLAAVVFCFFINYDPWVHHALGHLEIFFSRVPVFLLGINAGNIVLRGRDMPKAVLPTVLLTLLSLVMCLEMEGHLKYHFPLFLERMMYIPLSTGLLLLLGGGLKRLPKRAFAALKFVGGISLEVYLVHVEFVLKPLQKCGFGYWMQFFIIIAVSLPVAWGLNRLSKRITKAVESRSGK